MSIAAKWFLPNDLATGWCIYIFVYYLLLSEVQFSWFEAMAAIISFKKQNKTNELWLQERINGNFYVGV